MPLVGRRVYRILQEAGRLNPASLRMLIRQPVGDLAAAGEMGLRAAERLRAADALARALGRPEVLAPLKGPGQVAQHVLNHLGSRLENLEQEQFHAVLLDARHRPIRTERISQGTLTASIVHPREVFRSAIRCSAASLVVAHNHPSGDPEPSAEDLALTRRLLACGKLVGVPLLDHVIIGEGVWVSLRQRIEF